MPKTYNFLLNEFELLRGINQVSKQDGGSLIGWDGSVGAVGYEPEYIRDDGTVRPGHVWTGGHTYKRNRLISIELKDEAVHQYRGDVPNGRHAWKIRAGFCQSQITRAPRGGFDLELEPSILQFATSVDDVYDLFYCQVGPFAQRQEKIRSWFDRCVEKAKAKYIGIPAGFGLFTTMHNIVHEDALSYAMQERTIG